ncbi:hypothetical protein MMC29_003491 [Sticta canariensis]|nr:hypothetical protein [Sticta canariensis]
MSKVYALNLRVQQLEKTVANQSQRLVALAPSQEKPAHNGAPAPRNNRSILYDAEAKPLSDAPEVEKRDITSIQELRAAGKAKDEIVKHLLEAFPDLYKE